MGVCEECDLFRRVKPWSQLLATAIGTTDAAISTQLTKIQEDEHQVQAQEFQEREDIRMQAEKNYRYRTRPVMSSYCEKEDDKHTTYYYVPQLKNAGGKCNEFRERQPKLADCKTCVHRVDAEGWAEDLNNEQTYAAMSAENVTVGQSTSTSDTLLGKFREAVGAKKGFEVFGAYSAQGILMTKPKYLAYCKKFSGEGEYVICVLQNPHQTCPAHEKSDSSRPLQSGDKAKTAITAPPVAERPMPTLGQVRTENTPIDSSADATADVESDAPIALGDPPLTRKAAGSFLELLYAMAEIAQGQDPAPLTEQGVDDGLQELAADYGSFSPELKAYIVDSPSKLAQLRAVWPQTSASDKGVARISFANELKSFAQQLAAIRQLPIDTCRADEILRDAVRGAFPGWQRNHQSEPIRNYILLRIAFRDAMDKRDRNTVATLLKAIDWLDLNIEDLAKGAAWAEVVRQLENAARMAGNREAALKLESYMDEWHGDCPDWQEDRAKAASLDSPGVIPAMLMHLGFRPGEPTGSDRPRKDEVGQLSDRVVELDRETEQLTAAIVEAQKKGDGDTAAKLQLQLQQKRNQQEMMTSLTSTTIKARGDMMKSMLNNFR